MDRKHLGEDILAFAMRQILLSCRGCLINHQEFYPAQKTLKSIPQSLRELSAVVCL